MVDEKEQKELFEFEPPKRTFLRIGKIFPLPANNLGIKIPFERAIFISIGIIMALVVVYALGVERGKSMKLREIARLARQVKAPVATPASPAPLKIASRPATVQVSVKNSEIVQPKPENGIYTIVVVTFSNQNMAQQEVVRLKKEGFDAYVAPSNSYFQVRIGSYPSKESGQKMLNKVRRVYKDAYFKVK